MSLLSVEDVSHNFGDRVLFKDVSFRLLDGEHVGIVGANGVGKSTLMNILTGKLLKDNGKVEWTPRVRYGYLDQHTLLTAGKTVRDVLKDAFLPLLELEHEMLAITDKMGRRRPRSWTCCLSRWATFRSSSISAIFTSSM